MILETHLWPLFQKGGTQIIHTWQGSVFMSHPTLQSFFPHELLSFCSFKGGPASARLWGRLHQAKRAHSFTMWMVQGGGAMWGSEKWQREYKPRCHQYGAYYHSRGKGECPFRYRLSHLVTQRSQWQSGFEGKSWIHMVELRASGTLVKLTDLYSQYIYFEQSLAKLLRLALNLPYSWLSFPSSCVTCLHARDWFVIFLFP